MSGDCSARRLIRPNDFDTSTELTDWDIATLLSGEYGVSGDNQDRLRPRAAIAFTAEHARIASEANARYGKSAGSSSALNLLNLMVYAVAKDRDMPILFTGRDFTSTDVGMHPSSRVDG